LGDGVEAEQAVGGAGDGGQFAAAGGEEGAFGVDVPLDGVEDADGPLGGDEAVTEFAGGGFVREEGAGGRVFGGHRGAVTVGCINSKETDPSPPRRRSFASKSASGRSPSPGRMRSAAVANSRGTPARSHTCTNARFAGVSSSKSASLLGPLVKWNTSRATPT